MTFMVICLFTITNVSAGWIHTTRGYACDPATSEPGTCIWVDEPSSRPASTLKDENSFFAVIENFIAEYNLFDYFLD